MPNRDPSASRSGPDDESDCTVPDPSKAACRAGVGQHVEHRLGPARRSRSGPPGPTVIRCRRSPLGRPWRATLDSRGVSVRVYTGPHSDRGGGPSGWMTYLPWGFAGATILGQIVWVLVGDGARTALSILTVVTFFLASATPRLPQPRARPGPGGFLAITLAFGWGIEVLGLATSFPFGTYAYSDDLGPTLGGVPLVIPMAWSMMAYPCLLAAQRLSATGLGTALIGGWVLAAWDLFLDPQMVGEGYWTWSDVGLGAARHRRDPAAELPRLAAGAIVLMWLLDRLPAQGRRGRRARRRCSPGSSPPTSSPTSCSSAGPGVALWGGICMGVVVVPYLWRTVEPAAMVTARLGAHSSRPGPPRVGRRRRRTRPSTCATCARPTPDAPTVDEPVTVLIPARDEAAHVETTVRSVLAQTGVPRPRASSCSTTDRPTARPTIVRAARRATTRGSPSCAAGHEPPPPGWLGKPWACQRLADEADGSVLVFVDADVVLHPHAVRAVRGHPARPAASRWSRPTRIQEAGSWLERLVQPLVTWSWAATMPLRWARDVDPALALGRQRPVPGRRRGRLPRRRRPRRGAARRDRGRRAHARPEVERAAHASRSTAPTWPSAGCTTARRRSSTATRSRCGRRSTGRSAPSPSTPCSSRCTSCPPSRPSSAHGTAAPASSGSLGLRRRRRQPRAGRRRTGERVLPDALAQPASIAAFAALNAISWRRHARGTQHLEGPRPVTVTASRMSRRRRHRRGRRRHGGRRPAGRPRAPRDHPRAVGHATAASSPATSATATCSTPAPACSPSPRSTATCSSRRAARSRRPSTSSRSSRRSATTSPTGRPSTVPGVDPARAATAFGDAFGGTAEDDWRTPHRARRRACGASPASRSCSPRWPAGAPARPGQGPVRHPHGRAA